ncbi:galactokinase [Thermodesulfobacteriota bacterium]
MSEQIKRILEFEKVEASAPCRIDMGGTLDIDTFYYPLKHLGPCTFNIALSLRTRVTLLPNQNRMVKVSSKGFKSAEYLLPAAPFNHPLGLIFAVAAFFGAEGVHIIIDSSSPPRSALGGSSVAAVALVAAFAKASGQIKALTAGARKKIALLAQRLEVSVAGVPCGLQDQLAAVYGGVNAWYWQADLKGTNFKRKAIFRKHGLKKIERHLLLAYCGVPHESKNINTKWVRQFLVGRNRDFWEEISICTEKFVRAIQGRNFRDAVVSMNMETAIRRRMTPDVLDELGNKLVDSAIKNNCGARFAGAGGGGSIWALGDLEDIDKLKGSWETVLSERKGAGLLEVHIDPEGLRFD